MMAPALVTCSFCGPDQSDVPRLVTIEDGAAICSPCVFRCLQVLVTGDEVSPTEDPSFA